ncbi:TRAP transporter small permease [Oceanibacterium hippocampi]|uniref:TRAP transporter small permease protein n=1 Tax=Oceanibacterium hippocampi TaxID=745714 RepID=A0A1Y5U0C2_9PROT|nr:TRAP transporter small permease [Oceanibacterium hippocampi]SLN77821.1 2,3-diketo-L-gulonate TRAP transporter small permease protein YiaM [Oceanibacterium hippocampi]
MLRVVKILEAAICVTFVVAIVALTSMQIVARYGMSQPFTWTEELSRFALISLTFLGAALVTGSSGHIVVDLSGPTKGRWSRLVDTLSSALVVLSGLFLSVMGASKALSLGGIKASATGVPLAALYWIMAAGFALMSVHALARLFSRSGHATDHLRGI